MNMNTKPKYELALPLRYDGNRIYDAEGRELLVATKSDPHLRNHAIDTAYEVCLAVNTQKELLATLESALASIEGQAELLRHCGAAYGIGATLAQARAAIAKATGGAA